MPPRASGADADVVGLDDAMSRDHDWGLRLNRPRPGRARRRRRLRRAATRASARHVRGTPDPLRHDRGTRRSCATGSQVGTTVGVLRRVAARASTRVRALTDGGLAVADRAGGPRGRWRARCSSTHAGELTARARRASRGTRTTSGATSSRRTGRVSARSCPSSAGPASAGTSSGRASSAVDARGRVRRCISGHLLERRWPPYAKWLGTSFAPTAAARARRPAPLQARRGGQRLARAGGRPRAMPCAMLQPAAGGSRTPDRRGSGRAVLGPALPGCACGRRRRGDAEHHRPVSAGAAPWRRVGRAVERQRRCAHAPRSSPATVGSSGR